MVDSAYASAHAFGAAVVIADGLKTLTRTHMGGYARISATTQMWAEEGDPMPGQPRYSTVIPFYPPAVPDPIHDILVRGGRDFILDLTILNADGVVEDITNAVFVGQIRKYRYSRYSQAQFGFEILDGPTGRLRLRLTPAQTTWLTYTMFRGLWDLEMQKNGIESTVVPESKVRILPGISQGTIVGAQTGLGTGMAVDSG